MEHNPDVMQNMSKFRNEQFYQETLHIGRQSISYFIIKQILERKTPEASLCFDATFKICPLTFKQLFVVLAKIEGN